MKIVVLGSRGLLGQALCRTLTGNAIGLDRVSLDITHGSAVRNRLMSLVPDLVINAAGWTDVDAAEANPAAAHAINAEAVRHLALVCRDAGAALLHFSTDHVFDGERTPRLPYHESDRASPINVYGRTKLLGEDYIREILPRHFIIRTCGLYGARSGGHGKRSFVEAIAAKARRGERLKVVADQECTPTSVDDLAQAVKRLLESHAYGLYHLTNASECTWFEFAETVLRLLRFPADLSPISTAAYATAAKRPAYSVLDCDKWVHSGFKPLRPWQAALEEHLRTIEKG